jgi:hypothetical protein
MSMRSAAPAPALALSVLALAFLGCPPAAAQLSFGPVNGKINYAYVPPKSLKYVPTLERLQQFRFLEQLSEFFSPLRLPHTFSMTTVECGMANAFYAPTQRRIAICYEFVEAIERAAPKPGEVSEFSYEEVVIGGLVRTTLHELAHATFDMLQVPVAGREEDAADQLAIYIALQFSPEVARTVVRGAAYVSKVWYGFSAPVYWDEHGTGLQRYYNMLCLAFGGMPDQFKEFVDKSDLPRSRADNCRNEYEQIRAAFAKTVLPFIDRAAMQKVRERSWLKLTPEQAALLRQQQQEKQGFTLAACNQSKSASAALALLVRLIDEPQQWRALGWFAIPDGGCEMIGSFFGDHLFWYAEAKPGVWRAPDTDRTAAKQCIDRVNSFNVVADSRCPRGYVPVNFIRRDLNPSVSAVTLRLTGGK